MLHSEKFKDVSIESITEESFLGYAMSTLKGRSLADVRDGLKPVQRRILYAMYKLNNMHDKPYKKSARIVGDVIGKYHPHGDSSVYDAMVRMAQEWKLRYPLVQGHGNFGSIDGDAVAAMRYTESRMSEIASVLLRNLEYDTVDMKLNFDEQEKEPEIIPAVFPNLLVNGVKGVATGFATGMLPNNINEVCDAILAYLENPESTVEELAEHMHGPDFPTGALMLDREGIKDVYLTGRGEVTVRGEVDFEYVNGRECLIVNSIPMDVNKEKLIESIKQLQIEYNYSKAEFEKESKKNTGKRVELKGMDFIDMIRDETDSEYKSYQVRIVMELKEGKNPQMILNNLYKRTDLQKTFVSNNLALVPKIRVGSGEVVTMPTMCNLKVLVEEYVKHQKNVITRKTKFLLKKAREEMYLLGAVIIALNKLDETVEIIKKATSRQDALEELMAFLEIEQAQASHILKLRLQTLASFEQNEKIEEHRALAARISELQVVLNDEQLVTKILKEEIMEIKVNFGDERRTQIIPDLSDISDERLIPKEDIIVMMTSKGFIKRIPYEKYRLQKRNGKGSNGMEMFEGDYVKHLLITNTHDTLCLFTKKGEMFKMKGYELPVLGDKSKGVNIKSIFDLGHDSIQAIVAVSEFTDDKCLLFTTKKGVSKRTLLSEYTYGVKSSIKAIKLKEDDDLIAVTLTENNAEEYVTFVTKKGISLTIEVKQLKIVSRIGSGVAGINLRENDEVVQALIHDGQGMLFIATSKGYGKKTSLSEFRITNRKGRGVTSIKTTKEAVVVDAIIVGEEEEVIQLTKMGKVMKFKVDAVSATGRVTQGLRIINLSDDDELIAISSSSIEENEETNAEENETN